MVFFPRLETGVAGRAKPFGVEIRNVKCLRCGNYGHQSGDRECPLKDAIMPNEESRLKRDDPLTAIQAQTDCNEVTFWRRILIYSCLIDDVFLLLYLMWLDFLRCQNMLLVLRKYQLMHKLQSCSIWLDGMLNLLGNKMYKKKRKEKKKHKSEWTV